MNRRDLLLHSLAAGDDVQGLANRIAGRYPCEISSSQERRVPITRAILSDPTRRCFHAAPSRPASSNTPQPTKSLGTRRCRISSTEKRSSWSRTTPRQPNLRTGRCHRIKAGWNPPKHRDVLRRHLAECLARDGFARPASVCDVRLRRAVAAPVPSSVAGISAGTSSARSTA